MKKILCIILALTLLLVCIGCAKSEDGGASGGKEDVTIACLLYTSRCV